MTAWSSIFRDANKKLFSYMAIFPKKLPINGQIRCMSEERVFKVKPTSWHWNRFKDLLHLYTLVGLIPVGITIFCVNVFIGPATLEPIPEGYRPKHWEYFKHPLERFIARYLLTPPQQDYEKYLQYLYTHQEAQKLKFLQVHIENLIAKRRDYDGISFSPYIGGKYVYKYRKANDELKDYV